MIIDGKLVVAKKKKAVLVQELKKLGFTPFPKGDDAKKAGEIEDVQEDDEESDDAETEVSANDYDYLLGVSVVISDRLIHTNASLDGHLVLDTRARREVTPTDWRQGAGD